MYLLTVLGGKSGQPRTVPIVIWEHQGRRYGGSTYGIVLEIARDLSEAGPDTIFRPLLLYWADKPVLPAWRIVWRKIAGLLVRLEFLQSGQLMGLLKSSWIELAIDAIKFVINSLGGAVGLDALRDGIPLNAALNKVGGQRGEKGISIACANGLLRDVLGKTEYI